MCFARFMVAALLRLLLVRWLMSGGRLPLAAVLAALIHILVRGRGVVVAPRVPAVGAAVPTGLGRGGVDHRATGVRDQIAGRIGRRRVVDV